MRKIAESSHTGSDRILFYDMGDDVIRIVHLQEWTDLVGEREAKEMDEGKYNVVAHDVCVYGYDGKRGYLTSDPNDYRKSKVCGFGESVHASLQSCGFELVQKNAHITIFEPYSGRDIATGSIETREVRLVIAEAMYGYGAGDRVYDESGNNARTLLRDARNA